MLFFVYDIVFLPINTEQPWHPAYHLPRIGPTVIPSRMEGEAHGATPLARRLMMEEARGIIFFLRDITISKVPLHKLPTHPLANNSS